MYNSADPYIHVPLLWLGSCVPWEQGPCVFLRVRVPQALPLTSNEETKL